MRRRRPTLTVASRPWLINFQSVETPSPDIFRAVGIVTVIGFASVLRAPMAVPARGLQTWNSGSLCRALPPASFLALVFGGGGSYGARIPAHAYEPAHRHVKAGGIAVARRHLPLVPSRRSVTHAAARASRIYRRTADGPSRSISNPWSHPGGMTLLSATIPVSSSAVRANASEWSPIKRL